MCCIVVFDALTSVCDAGNALEVSHTVEVQSTDASGTEAQIPHPSLERPGLFSNGKIIRVHI